MLYCESGDRRVKWKFSNFVVEGRVPFLFNQGKVRWAEPIRRCGFPVSFLRWGLSQLIRNFWLCDKKEKENAPSGEVGRLRGRILTHRGDVGVIVTLFGVGVTSLLIFSCLQQT